MRNFFCLPISLRERERKREIKIEETDDVNLEYIL